MTDSTNEKDQAGEVASFRVDARVRDEEEKRPWNAPLWRALGEVVAFIPTYRSTREGRKKAKQMRVIFIGLGIGLMAIGGTADQWGAFWIILGVFLACLAFVAPVEDLKKRGWRGKIKNNQKPKKVPLWKTGEVVYDGRRVELHVDGEKVRRLRVDRDKHELTNRKQGSQLCLGVLPLGGKTKGGIWICTDDQVEESIESEGTIGARKMDRPATVDGADWERLWEALNK